MKRGEVRWYKFSKPDKRRPVVILTRDSALEFLGEVTVAPTTSTIREIPTDSPRLSSLAVAGCVLDPHAFKGSGRLAEELDTVADRLLSKLLHNPLQELLPVRNHGQEEPLPFGSQEHLFSSTRTGVFDHLDQTEGRAGQ